MRVAPVLCLAGLVAGAPLGSQTVEIDNPAGGIQVLVLGGERVRARPVVKTRAARPGDIELVHEHDRIRIVARPRDGARVDVEVTLPYRLPFRAETISGPISVRGLIHEAVLVTQNGDLELAVPWRATRLYLEAREEPSSVTLPESLRFSRRTVASKEKTRWVLQDRLSETHITGGRILVETGAIRNLTLIDIPYPEDAPVKLPWQAPAILESLLAPTRQTRAGRQPPPPSEPPQSPMAEGTAVFRSDVRIVALTVSVTGADGAPLTRLLPEDFEVLEDGAGQQVRYAGSEEEPFNLALLLDLSGSTQHSRKTMQEAARGFIGIARPQDQVAMYALANDKFMVVSRLTKDRARLPRALEDIPGISGGTPLYDVIVLAYAEELRHRPEERNALIVITDGADNQISAVGVPSEVSFHKLRRAAESMNALIYPILLDPFDKVPPPRWAKLAFGQMQELARASGGRSFTSRAIDRLAPVYPLVAGELRSVYHLGYSPRNQDFNGAWRRISVHVKRRGARVRTRPGYYAR